MKNHFVFIATSLATSSLFASAASAQHGPGGNSQFWQWWQTHFGGGDGPNDPTLVHGVPEIDASSGLLAMAAIAAALLLAWEINRRRKSA